MPVTLREAGTQEAELITDIQAAAALVAFAHIYPDEPYPFDRIIRRWTAFNGRLIVAEERGRPVGFVAFDNEELHALYVLPECWGRGIGQQLLESAGSVSGSWVLEDNHRARRFYELRGWCRDPEGVRDAFGVREIRYRR